MTATRPIGGVMPAEAAAAPASGSVWEAWSGKFAYAAAFATARSALAALLRQRGVARVWLPAYVCSSLAAGAAAGAREVAWYAVGSDLAPESAAPAAGDAIVVVDYFGRADETAWRDLVEARPDVLWIEDCAQALDTAAPPLGEVRLFSPRKLFGVADGGLLFANTPVPEPSQPADDGLWAAEKQRALDPNGERPQTWFGLFRAREDGFGVEDASATARTLAALRATPTAPAQAARRQNWRVLADGLASFALWPDRDAGFAPLAFPILCEDAAGAQRALAAERIWAPRHWADLPSDPARFPEAHALARRMLSLPCDQRYGPADMTQVIDVVRRRVEAYPR